MQYGKNCGERGLAAHEANKPLPGDARSHSRTNGGVTRGSYIRKKTFAYFLDDHHSDGIVGVTCKVLPGDNKALVASDPARFYMPAYVASRGWIVAFKVLQELLGFAAVGRLAKKAGPAGGIAGVNDTFPIGRSNRIKIYTSLKGETRRAFLF